MQDAHRAHLFDNAVEGTAVRAFALLLAHLDDALHGGGAAHVVVQDERVRKLLREARTLLAVQQHARARLADALQHRDERLKVADVEDGQRELDVAVVARALLQTQAARCARRVLVRDAQPTVEHAARDRRARRLLVALVRDHLELGRALDLLFREGAELDV